MRVFCDTNVLVAAALEAHVNHSSAKAVLEHIFRRDDTGFISGHSLAETFSVLSRMPTAPKLTSQDVLSILEKNILPRFTLVTLAAADYPNAVRTLAATGRGGGRIYDLLHIIAARKQTLDRIYTFNDAEWKISGSRPGANHCFPAIRHSLISREKSGGRVGDLPNWAKLFYYATRKTSERRDGQGSRGAHGDEAPPLVGARRTFWLRGRAPNVC